MIPFYKPHTILGKNHVSIEKNEITNSFISFTLNKSCSQALELAVLSLNLKPKDEIILPSYSFVSLANAINNFGFKPIFVDCESDTMNISAENIVGAISSKTRAVISINYSGIGCDYDSIVPICKKYGLYLIEDNAHGILASYKGVPLGSFGDIATFSFDHLKMITCYEGGATVVNNEKLYETYSLASEFGTNRIDFLNQKTNFYEWKFKGTNSKLAEPLKNILEAQLFHANEIVQVFKDKWDRYHKAFKEAEDKGYLKRMFVPDHCQHNGYMYWFKTTTCEERNLLMNFLMEYGIYSAFHYTPLHTSEFGRKVGVFRGEDKNTTSGSACLLRLPHFYDLTYNEQDYVIEKIYEFYRQKR